MEKNRQQDTVPKEKEKVSVVCQCNGETQPHVCCCAHKGGSGCKYAHCKNDSGDLNRSEE